jgi:hypothetical protein
MESRQYPQQWIHGAFCRTPALPGVNRTPPLSLDDRWLWLHQDLCLLVLSALPRICGEVHGTGERFVGWGFLGQTKNAVARVTFAGSKCDVRTVDALDGV